MYKTMNALFDKLPHALIGLLARVIPATIFFKSGLTKIDDIPKTIDLFKEVYALPLLPPVWGAYLSTTAELALPVLLVFGLFTRYAALALLGMTLIIQTFVFPESYLEHGLWAVCFLVLIKYGAGELSLDRLIFKRP